MALIIICTGVFVWLLAIAAFGGCGGGSWSANPKTITKVGEWVRYADGNSTVLYKAFKYNPKTEEELKATIDSILGRKT